MNTAVANPSHYSNLNFTALPPGEQLPKEETLYLVRVTEFAYANLNVLSDTRVGWYYILMRLGNQFVTYTRDLPKDAIITHYLEIPDPLNDKDWTDTI